MKILQVNSWADVNLIKLKKKKFAYYLLLLIKLFITCYNNDNQYYYNYENWKLSYLGNVDFVHRTGIMLFTTQKFICEYVHLEKHSLKL